MAEILYGKPVAQFLDAKTKEQVEYLKQKNRIPTLALVRVGDNPGDLAYERGLKKKCGDLGIEIKPYVFEHTVSQDQIFDAIEQINADEMIHGCMIFRPLPQHLNEKELCEALSAEKDVDGITSTALKGIFLDESVGYPPCTAQACIELLDYYHIPIEGSHCAVIGRSLVVGKPLSMMLLNRNATVTVCHSKTKNMAESLKNVDIIISAVGKSDTLTEQNVDNNQTVLDVGINFNNEGKMVGDTAQSVYDIVSAYTPVPGGIGAITTGVLAAHVVDAAMKSLYDKN